MRLHVNKENRPSQADPPSAMGCLVDWGREAECDLACRSRTLSPRSGAGFERV